MHFSRDQLMGSAFVAFGIILFVGFFYAAIVSKLLPPYENRLLSAVQNDSPPALVSSPTPAISYRRRFRGSPADSSQSKLHPLIFSDADRPPPPIEPPDASLPRASSSPTLCTEFEVAPEPQDDLPQDQQDTLPLDLGESTF